MLESSEKDIEFKTFCCLSPLSPLQKTLRSKGVGTLSKKFKAPEITEADKIQAAAEVKKNTVKLSILELWKRLQVRHRLHFLCHSLRKLFIYSLYPEETRG